MLLYFISVNLQPFDSGQADYTTLITPVGSRSPSALLFILHTHAPSLLLQEREKHRLQGDNKCFYLHFHSDKRFLTYINTPHNLLPCLSTYFWPHSLSLISPQHVMISSVSPLHLISLSLSPLLFSLSHCLSCRPPSLPASSVIPLSPSVVVLNKQQGVVGRGLHSRWVCESPAGGEGRGGWEHHSFSLALSLPFSLRQTRGHSWQVG